MGGTLISAWTGAAGMLSPRRLHLIRVLPQTTLLGSNSHGGVGGAWASPRPGCSLLGAALCALGSAAVVPDEAAETHSHGRVTVIHSHHSHLLSRRPVRQAQAANVGLREEKAQKASAWAPTGGTCQSRIGAEDIGRPRVDSLVLN